MHCMGGREWKGPVARVMTMRRKEKKGRKERKEGHFQIWEGGGAFGPSGNSVFGSRDISCA